jgi:hypothetical protein
MEELTHSDKKVLKDLYKATLPGAIITYLKKNGSASLQDLKSHISKIYSTLRNPIGGRYKGKNMDKIIKGALSEHIFIQSDDLIHLNVFFPQTNLLPDYQDKKIASILSHRSKHKKRFPIRLSLSAGKRSDNILLVDGFCERLKRDPDFCSIFDEPFKVRVF